MMRPLGGHWLVTSGLDVGRPLAPGRGVSVCVPVVVGRAATRSVGERHGPKGRSESARASIGILVTQQSSERNVWHASEREKGSTTL